ncbi:uncharacterized protein BT62DRAFT_936122 [Guyanagaster necrorhizus]|uniref:Uncharacterized protein n=1 Tax=Guyanagaster necrorhizus TaxID=856835 RepID=A0A9P8ANU0_9AGAR|nr:uncharacterized protein BT62DRAFT_936098 [Guyanagaster necrorhizus MCA 3950]XP_043035780.1 uncharacterized protein BT62DRAFT_936122 [Guyanagaster necrorhizus MCA 3950]KAG7442263.1 hypothetical protein BT62DRAFT_936098 [Guyanagaster necrorhizus MCA 3950]KAG7442280.1 hypothetical protein BT62DRAFT_936122 [Guyanagaster necrorhizus MCA 3950]
MARLTQLQLTQAPSFWRFYWLERVSTNWHCTSPDKQPRFVNLFIKAKSIEKRTSKAFSR